MTTETQIQTRSENSPISSLQILQNQELTRNIPKIELSILHACNSEKIIDEHGFRMEVAKVLVMAGINKTPDDLTISICFNMLKTHFAEFTTANFLQAFEFNIAGLYEIKHNHFYSFDADYMSNCLNGYRKMKAQAWNEYNQAKRSMPEKEIKSSNEEIYNSLKRFIETENQMPRFWDWNSAYEHMEETGIIKISLEEKNKLLKAVTKEIEGKREFAVYLSDTLEINDQLTEQKLKTECRRRVVCGYLGRGLK